MAKVTFTPAFAGDEYRAVGFRVTQAGDVEVDQDRADYLVQTFPDRFAYAERKDEPAPKSESAPEAKGQVEGKRKSSKKK